MRRFVRRAASSVAAAALLVAPLSCFSERSSGPGTNLDDCNVELPAEAFGSTIVVIRDFNFSPAQVTVSPGAKVTWVNCEPAGTAAHTSTADAGTWTSALLAPGSTYTRVFSGAGSFPYHCNPHPGMRGSVTVQ